METEEFAKRYARTIAFGMGIAAFSAGSFIMLGWTHFNFWIAAMWGGFVWGIVYVAVFYVMSPKPSQLATVPAPIINPELAYDEDESDEEDVPEERPQQVDQVEFVQESARFYHLGTRQVQLPETVKPQHLNLILAARSKGRLPDVTENKLNKIGISRFAMPPNARTTMDFLQRQGMLDRNGQWTEMGERCFPYPSSPAA